MIKVPEKISQKKRIILGPLSRFLLKIFKWDITGEIPNLSKMVLIGAPHSAMRDAWYGLLAVLALDLKVTFYGASWIFTRLPSLITFSKNLDKLGIPWPLGWLQKIILIRLGGVPVYRVNSRGTIKAAIDKLEELQEKIERAKKLHLDPQKVLGKNDSYKFFKTVGGHIRTGTTGTNVSDVYIQLAL